MIRFAKPKDIDELIRLCAEHARFERAEYCEDGKRERLAELLFCDHPNIRCLVVEQHSKICGYASLTIQYSTWMADKYLYLDCLFIRPEYRGLGIGHQVMETVYSLAVESQCFEIQWQTPEFNQDAIRFYDRFETNRNEKQRYVWPAHPSKTESQ